MELHDFQFELVKADRNALEQFKGQAWLRAKSDLLEITGAFGQALSQIAPERFFRLQYFPSSRSMDASGPRSRLWDLVPPDFTEEIMVQAVLVPQEFILLDRFYLLPSGHYPILGFLPDEQIIPLGDKEAIQQRFLIQIASYRSRLIAQLAAVKATATNPKAST